MQDLRAPSPRDRPFIEVGAYAVYPLDVGERSERGLFGALGLEELACSVGEDEADREFGGREGGEQGGYDVGELDCGDGAGGAEEDVVLVVGLVGGGVEWLFC